MSADNQYIDEPKISLAYLIKRVVFWFNFILSKWLTIGLGTVCFILLMLAWNYLKPQVYTAKTTFVLDQDGGEGLGDIGSLASLAGVNLGSITEGSVLFQIDNIQELYRSKKMIETTLLSPSSDSGSKGLLIERFAESNQLKDDWESEGVLLEDFRKKREYFSRAQDSLLQESVKLINEQHLIVGKPNRKATLLEVGFEHKDEVLAKVFTEEHVENVNQFYLETKTKKSLSNLKILQDQADSIKKVLDKSILQLAEVDERIPNPNPLIKTSQVPYQKAMIDVQANGAIYQEIVKQLELAKVTHRNQMPLIQIVDVPRYPLPSNRWKLFKTLLLGGALGVFLMVLYVFFRQIIRSALSEEP